jgi:hypothetical protein
MQYQVLNFTNSRGSLMRHTHMHIGFTQLAGQPATMVPG